MRGLTFSLRGRTAVEIQEIIYESDINLHLYLQIIVSDWVVAERLSECKSADLKALASTFLNCYLIQLMETGLLHADPHPGNLMRTADGKLVILDFGLMTEVNENQRIGLVEFIAHLTMEDWDSLFMDLVTLGEGGMNAVGACHPPLSLSSALS